MIDRVQPRRRALAHLGALHGLTDHGVDALEHALLVAVTETTTEDDIEVLARELEASIKETV